MVTNIREWRIRASPLRKKFVVGESLEQAAAALKGSKLLLSVPGGESEEELPGGFSSNVRPRASEGEDVFGRARRPHDAALAQKLFAILKNNNKRFPHVPIFDSSFRL